MLLLVDHRLRRIDRNMRWSRPLSSTVRPFRREFRLAIYHPAESCYATTEKPCVVVRSAFSLSRANIHVARAKKAILQKKRTLGSSSSERTVRRQPFDVSEVSGRIPTAPLPGFVAPMQAMLVDSIRPTDWIYEIKFDGYRAVALRSGKDNPRKESSGPEGLANCELH